MAYRLFEGSKHAALYSKFRPSYPTVFYERILGYLKEKSTSLNQLVDVGCGPGQSTKYLAGKFNNVVATDISEAQIEAAKKSNDMPNTTFVVSPAESLPLENASVDLITCGQSFHWFDAPKFYKECDRVLKPFGCLALYGYAYNYFKDDACQSLFDDFQKSVDSYFSDRRALLDNHYRDVCPPFEDVTRDESFENVVEISVANYISYLSSWSGYRAYHQKVEGEEEELLNNFKQSFPSAPSSTTISTMQVDNGIR